MTVSNRIYMVRHGRASAGWDTALDPELDELGHAQAVDVADQLQSLQLGNIISSPLLRCQQTAAPLARMWNVVPQVCVEVSEIPSPKGVAMSDRIVWLRQAMQGTWSELGSDYVQYRDCITDFVRGIQTDAVIFSHFIAINAVIGGVLGDDRLLIRSLDNCSTTIFERDTTGNLSLVQGGHEADTLIR
jgi:broad specificity phosphatase PhoE